MQTGQVSLMRFIAGQEILQPKPSQPSQFTQCSDFLATCKMEKALLLPLSDDANDVLSKRENESIFIFHVTITLLALFGLILIGYMNNWGVGEDIDPDVFSSIELAFVKTTVIALSLIGIITPED